MHHLTIFKISITPEDRLNINAVKNIFCIAEFTDNFYFTLLLKNINRFLIANTFN